MKAAQRFLTGVLTAGLIGFGIPAPLLAQEVVSDERPSIAGMLENVTPAVVNIAVSGRVNVPENPLYNDPFFRRFFDLPEQMPETRQTMAVGSGVIIDAEQGYVVTNHHVVADAEQIEVTLRDRRQIRAELVGSDAGTDIALLKIDADDLTDIPLADSDTLRVGDYVVAIGNPFGIGQTVTSGIVSAVSRATGITGGEGYEDFIQTDASINPGNSGGALVDYNGNLVGINTAIIAPAAGNVGIGFAVPINMARAVVDQLIEFGEVQRGLLGVMIQDLTPAVAQVLGLDINRGAVVSQVQPDSAADQAGIEPGDVITRINGRNIDGSQDLRNTIGLMRPGTEIQLSLLREGERQDLELAIGGGATPAQEAPSVSTSNVMEGAQLAAAPAGREGVLVAAVQQGSRAWNNGLRQGDLIVEVNRQMVQSPQQVNQILAESEGGAAVTLMRDNQELFIVMR